MFLLHAVRYSHQRLYQCHANIEKEKNANKETNVEYVSATPLVFQADDGIGCYYREALKPLADACPSKGNTNATQ